jgi:drug/metabolite transporter (DMT)-like permease
MNDDTHSAARGILLSVLGFSLLSFGDTTIKYLSSYYSTYSLVFYNSLFGLIVLSLLSPWLGGLGATLKDKRIGLHLLRGALVFVQLSLIVYAFTQLSLAKAYSMAFMAPIFSALLGIPLLRDRVSLRQVSAIVLGFVGVLIILRPGLIPLEPASLAALASALFFSLVNITARYMRGSRHTLLSWAFYPHLVIITILVLAFLEELQGPRLQDLAYLAFMGGISAFGAIAIARAFAHARTATAASFHYIQMLWGVGLGYLFFGDRIDLWTSVGAVVIIASGLWLIRAERRIL